VIQQEGQDTREGESQPLRGDEQPAGAGEEYDTVAYLKNVTIRDGVSVSVPETIAVMQDIPIEISDEEMRAIGENAMANGWPALRMEGTELEGLYFLYPEVPRGDIWDISAAEHAQMAVQFLRESGLAELLESKGMTLDLDDSDMDGNLFWSTVAGYRASGFVRIGFEEGGVIGDGKIWAVKSTLLMTADAVPFEEAVENAFFVCGEGAWSDDETVYEVIGAKLVYIHGIPIYELTLPIPGSRGVQTAYALAVDEDVIIHSEMAAAYDEFLTYGF